MGLKFYVGEIQQQGNEASRMNSQAKQAISSLQSSTSQFLSAPLSGKAYDSAKLYFSTVYTPLCQSAILTGEALERAHKRLLSEYQGMVSSIDTDEDQIQSQIERFEQLKRELERQMHTAKTMRPDLERRYMNACDVISKKREQLEKFHAYNARSANIFAEYEACQQEFNNGLAQVKDCKAWNAASGTFDIGRLNMTWASPINARWQQREKMQQEKKNRLAKQAISSLDGYTIICSALGTKKIWYLMKDGKIISPKAHPNLYNQLEKCKDYLGKDQYKVEEVKVMRNEIPFSPALGGILGNIGKVGKGIDIIRKGIGTVKVGKSAVEAINSARNVQASKRVRAVNPEDLLPQQGLVTGEVEGAPPVDAGKQGKHQEGHRNNEQSTEDKSTWIDGENGVADTQEAWEKGDWVRGREGTVKEYESDKVVGSDGVTTEIVVHIDGKGNIHGYPKIPKEVRRKLNGGE
uniref:LXG domain-containing protein n=1 Tax=Candidatus Enterococcus mansonii TaxID=1834181 RepID=A0A242CDI9_9ENTE|nr:T7SS effector LXG polymorphic toxin [Enterococcus sp. 4G2_DIV0659]OTO08276.1 hypothetical protein A5880_002547 [Enterococcus sp. 4G2_DIV0659]